MTTNTLHSITRIQIMTLAGVKVNVIINMALCIGIPQMGDNELQARNTNIYKLALARERLMDRREGSMTIQKSVFTRHLCTLALDFFIQKRERRGWGRRGCGRVRQLRRINGKTVRALRPCG